MWCAVKYEILNLNKTYTIDNQRQYVMLVRIIEEILIFKVNDIRAK